MLIDLRILIHFAILSLFINLSYGQLKSVCYWPSYGIPEEIDPTLCTHIHYSFAILDEKSLLIKFPNPTKEANIINRLQKLKAKNPNVKLILSVGGWGDLSKKYSKMAANSTARTRFVEEGIKLLKQHKFEGMDLDWEFPVCWEDDCNAGPPQDKDNYSQLLKELKTAFDKQQPKLLLSAAVKANESIADRAYNFTTLARTLDYINVMTYDNLEAKPNKTGHHAGLEWTKSQMLWWTNKQIPKNKLLLGIPFYGKSFTLADPNKTSIGAPIKNNTGVEYQSFLQICKNIKFNGWTKRDELPQGHIAYQGNQWVGYDDAVRIKQKAEWVRRNGFGGVLVWEVALDDVKANCCSTNRPLLRAVNYGLFQNGSDPSSYKCE